MSVHLDWEKEKKKRERENEKKRKERMTKMKERQKVRQKEKDGLRTKWTGTWRSRVDRTRKDRWHKVQRA